jgi:hypothetical protein
MLLQHKGDLRTEIEMWTSVYMDSKNDDEGRPIQADLAIWNGDPWQELNAAIHKRHDVEWAVTSGNLGKRQPDYAVRYLAESIKKINPEEQMSKWLTAAKTHKFNSAVIGLLREAYEIVGTIDLARLKNSGSN